MEGIRYIQLDSRTMRLPCPALRPTELERDGSNLARVVGRLLKESRSPKPPEDQWDSREAMESWTDYSRYALPDLKEIAWGRREADNAEYIVLKYADGLECPSWLASDGTLRILALTLPLFAPDPRNLHG